MGPFIKEHMIDRFLSKVNKTNYCWEWAASLDSGGYGNFSIKHIVYKAHRVSYEFFINKIPKNAKVLHKCDNRKCINPSHLFLGTQIDNIRDMVSKGRQHKPKGSLHPKSKITEADVLEIRRLFNLKLKSRKELQTIYKLSKSNISKILLKQLWSHI